MRFSRRKILKSICYGSALFAPSINFLGGCDERIECDTSGGIRRGLVLPTDASKDFSEKDYYVWGANVIRGEDGLFHLFYSRWRKTSPSGFYSWVTSSEIAHAVSDQPSGPFEYMDTALDNASCNENWDSKCKHNPNIHFFDGRYYLYYMGTTGSNDNYWEHRNNQQIGCAISDSVSGPWTKLEAPLLRAGASSLGGLMVSNPSVVKTFDDRYIMFYKGVVDNGTMKGGQVSILSAESKFPNGPFHPKNVCVFQSVGLTFPFEDPYVFYHGGKYWAVVKDMVGAIGKRKRSLLLFSSEDAIAWDAHTELCDRRIRYVNGSYNDFYLVERPHVWLSIEGNGFLTCAVSEKNPWKMRDAVTSIVSLPFVL